MAENLFEQQYDLTKKSKLKEFYESYKILIYSSVFTLIILAIIFSFYQHNKEKKKILISENYIQAKVYLNKGDRNKAVEKLKNIIFSNDTTYSTLSLFMILNEDLINDNNEVSKLFDYLLDNNKFDEEVRNLLIYKKALYKSNYVEESKLLEEIKPLLNKKEFFLQILSTENLQHDLYYHAKLKLDFIADE